MDVKEAVEGLIASAAKDESGEFRVNSVNPVSFEMIADQLGKEPVYFSDDYQKERVIELGGIGSSAAVVLSEHGRIFLASAKGLRGEGA